MTTQPKQKIIIWNYNNYLFGCNARARTYANWNMQRYQLKTWRWSYLALTNRNSNPLCVVTMDMRLPLIPVPLFSLSWTKFLQSLIWTCDMHLRFLLSCMLPLKVYLLWSLKFSPFGIKHRKGRHKMNKGESHRSWSFGCGSQTRSWTWNSHNID
jgi:hypothetical protein